ncbi:MarR family winged helix-turn-helix transcriptional regulator [Terricaulis sp.]|uniref:MarR family winged helix-turn-helix transcriptional regulator n=1 Tax=Terricaulis sp. TaxID=2768686 RepID=UPI003784625B
MSGAESDTFNLADSASHLLHRAEQLASDRFTLLVGKDVTLRQFAVLAAIAQAPGVSQAELVRITGVDRSTIAGIVLRLQKHGWVERADAPTDKRANAVTLTSEGEVVLRAATKHAKAADAAILDALPRTKGKALIAILKKLTKHAEELAGKAEKQAKRQAKRDRVGAANQKDSKRRARK